MSDAPNLPAARQQRSMVTHDLLCDAAEEALREGGLALCTIQEVAKRAGRSGASVYRRFGDKDRMVVAVIERYLERVITANEAGFSLLAERYPHLKERLKVLVQGAVVSQRRDARLVRAFRDAAAGSANQALTETMVRMRDAVLDLARRALRDCSSEIARQDKELAVTFAVDMLMGAMEVLTNNDAPSMSDEAYQSELYEMLYGYLSSPEIDAQP